MSEVNSNVAVGDSVTFTGFTGEDAPDNGELLMEGDEYLVESINEGDKDNDSSVNLTIANPDFNSKKRPSKANPKNITVDVFMDEFSMDDETEAAEGKKVEAEATVKLTDVKKGDVITVLDTEGESLTGEVFKKTKAILGILLEEDDGSVDEVIYKVSEVDTIFAVDDQDEPEETEPEEAPEPKKTLAKKKTVVKKKAPVKKKAAAKVKEEPEEEEVVKKKTAPKKRADKKKTVAKKKTSTKPKATAGDPEDEDLKGLIILEESEESEEVLALVAEADDLCELVGELADEAAVQDYRLGGILYHVRVSKAFREILDGQYDVVKGFQVYVEAELGIGYRKAMYLIEIYTKWSKLGLPTESIAEIGWTKAQEISRVMEEGNADELIELAAESTVADLKETIKESYSKKGKDDREVVKKVTFKFRLTEDQGVAVEGYMEQAAEQLGLKKMEEVFEHIISEWSQEHLDVSSNKKTRSKRK